LLVTVPIHAQTTTGPRGVDIGMKVGTVVGAVLGFLFLIGAGASRTQQDADDSSSDSDGAEGGSTTT
jgi:hypothetical protein